MNSWLLMDDREVFLTEGWDHAPNADLKYPVYAVSDLVGGSDERTKQRRWQVMLESRCLYGNRIYETVHAEITPRYARQMATVAGCRIEVDAPALIAEVGVFFASFEDPKFLYKGTFKYWKTRFLKEFYAYANLLNFSLGGPLMNTLDVFSFLRAPVLLKIARGADVCATLGRYTNKTDRFEAVFRDILSRHQIADEELSVYGAVSISNSSRLLHSVLVALVARFCACWERLQDVHVREQLASVPLGNPDARFVATLQDAQARRVVGDLQNLRESYLRLMSASAEMFGVVLDAMPTRARPEVRNALDPFKNRQWSR